MPLHRVIKPRFWDTLRESRLRRSFSTPTAKMRSQMARLSSPPLHASAHAWANDTASEVTTEVASFRGAQVEVSTLVAEPGPLIAMKLQAIMNRVAAKQGTDLQDIARLVLDEQVRPTALAQLGKCRASTAADIALHVDLWLVRRRRQALRWIHDVRGSDLTLDDLDLVAELLLAECERA